MKELKEIISRFINLEINEINEGTIIDKSAVKGSILIHRLYSELSKVGVEIFDPKSIKTYGDLINSLNGIKKIDNNDEYLIEETFNNGALSSITGIGIDIEYVSNLPNASDFRIDNFYQENFTSKEITKCILSENPYRAFAALFSLKEAIYKSNNKILKGRKFNKLEVMYNSNGRPEVSGFILSSSHGEDLVISVAISLV